MAFGHGNMIVLLSFIMSYIFKLVVKTMSGVEICFRNT